MVWKQTQGGKTAAFWDDCGGNEVRLDETDGKSAAL